MSDGSGKVSFVWADGLEHTFFLGLKELRELQAKTGVGPYALYERITTKQFMVDDMRHVIRLGLIGGGHEPEDVASLMQSYVDSKPLLSLINPAIVILSAALIGPPTETDGKKDEAAPGQVTEGSTSLN